MEKRGRKPKNKASQLSVFKFDIKAHFILSELAHKQRRTKTAVLEMLIEKAGTDEKIEYPAHVV